MPKLTMTIKMDNDAFVDYPENEVSRIFAQAFEAINFMNLNEVQAASLYDRNGKTVGKISIDP